MRGANHYNWKGGKPKCDICQKTLSVYGISRCKKHRIFTEQMRKNIGNGHRGLHPSDNTKRKIGLANSVALKGRKLSEKHKRRIGEYNKMIGRVPPILVGAEHWNWKGGITPINRKIRCSKEYAVWRRAVLERDGYACIWCDETEHLEADHIKSFVRYPKLRFDINNGRTLCRSCHTKTPNYGGRVARSTKI